MNQPASRSVESTREASPGHQVGKVAAITLTFWVLKIIATTAGDVSGDLLSDTLGLGYVLSLGVASGAVLWLLIAQIRATRFHPALYWLLLLGTSTFGAELSDTLDRGLHLGYMAGAIVIFLGLTITLAIWRLATGRIPIYPIFKRRHELYYWCAAIFANTLGSVLGDLVGDHFGLGPVGSIVVNAGVLALLLVLHYGTKLNKPLLFWAAFVFSRA